MDILEQTLETSQDEIQLKGEDIEDSKPIIDGSDLTIIEDDGSISDDQTVDNLAHAQAILDADEEVQYQLRSSEGVTYRVVHVNPEDGEADGLNTIVGSNYSQSQSGTAVVASGISPNHFYVIGANEVFNSQSQRSLAPRSSMTIENRNLIVPTNSTRGRRDDRRRATHNEVERRRRDKINNWIAKLSKIIPDCNTVENSKGVQSKGGILARACEYIMDLRNSNARLTDCVKENDRLSSHVDFLQKQNEKLKIENALMKTLITQSGMQLPPEVTSSSRNGTSSASSSSLTDS